jgi:hypothetical protein
MKRTVLYASLLIAFAASQGFAQAPRVPAASGPGAGAPPVVGEESPDQVRRQLAAPLRNQFDPTRQQAPELELKTENVTPEMWLYMQEMRRYDDPLNAVRAHAADRAAQRRARLAAQAWFGFSNTRPQASPMPFTDMYSPTWVSNSWNPYGWIGSGHAWTTVRQDSIIITR